ncbi:Ser/Thr phosphatase family protein [Dictyocaulus viviparus]|uniref:Sphingomyelin phosphodiesterase n=1 Tax=Dictyocaulus viviparus TaxID=29172 RepID=A0A0D8XZ55_DICVI|nr:Ser/Thr phosphatase family protein [Dictyocaulus viviparus]
MKKRLMLLIVLLIAVANPSVLRQQYHSSIHDIGFSPVCSSCTALISALNLLVKIYKSEEVFLEFATIVCRLIAKQPWIVCDGITTQFRDEFFYVFRQLSERDPSQICGILLDYCADPTDETQQGWTITIPPKLSKSIMKELAVKKKKLAHSHFLTASQNLRVLQLTDLHIDFEYQPNSEADCVMPVCCRQTAGECTDEMLTAIVGTLALTDLHIDFEYQPNSEADCVMPVCCRQTAVCSYQCTDEMLTAIVGTLETICGGKKQDLTSVLSVVLVGVPTKAAGYWGTVGKCDIPYWTFKHMLEHINATHKIDYIMLSGDFINHVDWAYTVDGHIEVLKNISSLVRNYFPKIPTYWAVGNHEGVPVNSFAPHSVDERFWPVWLYEEFLEMNKLWLDSDAAKTAVYRGSYSVQVYRGLRLISLNSGFCETTNFFLYLNQSDPDGTMSWFVLELLKAELSGESVHVLSHIPPGDSECLEGWARNYYRVIQRFSDTITAQFFGHVHTDYFTVFYENMHNISSAPVGVLYAAPSVTTFSDMNPAYRIYEINITDNFKVENIMNYFADLEKATIENPPEWKLLYSAKDEYGLDDLSLSSWNKLVNIVHHDEKIAQKFFRNAVRAENKCDSTCQWTLLCGLRMGHHNSTLYCPQKS